MSGGTPIKPGGEGLAELEYLFGESMAHFKAGRLKEAEAGHAQESGHDCTQDTRDVGDGNLIWPSPLGVRKLIQCPHHPSTGA